MQVSSSTPPQSASSSPPQQLSRFLRTSFDGVGSGQSETARNSAIFHAFQLRTSAGEGAGGIPPSAPAKHQFPNAGPGATHRAKSVDSDIEILDEVNQPSTSRGSAYSSGDRQRSTTSTAPMARPILVASNSRAWKDHAKNTVYNMALKDHVRILTTQGIVVSQHQAVALRLKYIAEHVIRSLNEYGWAVVDNFLGGVHCCNICREVCHLYEAGLFSAGRLMDEVGPQNSDHSSAKEIRSDETCWFDGADTRTKPSVTVRLLISMVDSVIVHFKDRIQPYTIGGRSRAMIAVYPGNGTRYVKHVDNPVRDGRCITSIYYCNENWSLAEFDDDDGDAIQHGGALRLYPESSTVPMDVDPQADRLIFFFSDKRNPHEVMPVFRPRYAITIWYFDQREKATALESRKRAADEEGARVGSSNPQPPTVGMDTSTASPMWIPNAAKSSKAVPRKIKRINVCDSDSSDDSDVEEERRKDETRAAANRERQRDPADYYEI